MEDVLLDVAAELERRNPFMVGHLWRVSAYAGRLARRIGWSAARTADLCLAAALHNLPAPGLPGHGSLRAVGEANTPPPIRPPASRTGLDLVCATVLTAPVLAAIRTYQEHWDGSGTPLGLRGAAIPIEGRILAVIDAFDNLTSAHPFEWPPTPTEALTELVHQAGHHFCPEVVDSFIALWHEGLCGDILGHCEPHRSLLECPTCGPVVQSPLGGRHGDSVACPACQAALQLVVTTRGLALARVELSGSEVTAAL